MKYYKRKYYSRKWRRIGFPEALITFIKPRTWGCDYIIWHPDMLTVPNRIDCADAELLVIGREDARPIEGIRNIRRDEYYDELKRRVTEWFTEIRKRIYKTEHLCYITVKKPRKKTGGMLWGS